MKFKFTRKRLVIAAIIILIAAGGWFWWNNSQNKVVLVESVEIESVQVRESVSANGAITSENFADLKFLGSGTIASLNVKEGDNVNAKQTLASLDSYSASQSAKAAKDARDITLRNRDLFIEQYADNMDEIGGTNAYNIRLRTLNEQISQAEASYRAELGGLRNLNMQAPFNGTVVDVIKRVGEPVGPADTVLKVADLSSLYFEIDLDQEDFGKVRTDDIAEIELDAYPDEVFTGKVIGLPAYINSSTGSALKVKIQIDPKDDRPFLLGMEGDGTIIINQSTGTSQAVPFDAVFTEDDGRNYLWILNNGILNKKYIEVGIIGDAYTEVRDNLDGLTVVIPSDPNVEVNEGDKGQIANPQ